MQIQDFVAYTRKFLVALGAALGVLTISVSDNIVSNQEWLSILVAFLGALGVYTIPNKLTDDQIKKDKR